MLLICCVVVFGVLLFRRFVVSLWRFVGWLCCSVVALRCCVVVFVGVMYWWFVVLVVCCAAVALWV